MVRYRVRMVWLDDEDQYGSYQAVRFWKVQFKRPGWFKRWEDVSVHATLDWAVSVWNECLDSEFRIQGYILG